MLSLFNGILAWSVGVASPLAGGEVPHVRASGEDAWSAVVDSLAWADVQVLWVEGGALPGPQHQFWAACRALVLVMGRSGVGWRGSLPRGWSGCWHTLSHSSLGGVTSFRRRLQVLRPQSLPGGFVLKDSEGVNAVASSVIDARSPLVDWLDVEEPGVGSAFDPRRDLLDWGGLMEGKRFALPTAFRRSGWVQRELSPKEALRACDVPPSLSCRLPEAAQAALVRSLGSPVKVLAWVAHSFCLWRVGLEELEVDLGSGEERAEEILHGTPVQEVRSRGIENFGNVASPTVGSTIRSTVGSSPPTPLTMGKGGRFEGQNDQGFPCGSTCDMGLRSKERDAMHADAGVRAAKEDGAEIPYFLWDDRLASHLGLESSEAFDDRTRAALATIRRAAHGWWVQAVRRSWWAYWKAYQRAIRQVEPVYWRDIGLAGARAVSYAAQSSFWEWTNGSGLFFWRWPEEYQRDAALGLGPQWTGAPPGSMQCQGCLGKQVVQGRLLEKIEKLERRGYLGEGAVCSLLNYFAVQKGEADIRAVFDATKSGLNLALFANWFGLPQVGTMTLGLEPNYFCADNDVGEQFYNFPLHPELQQYCGIDVSSLRPDGPHLLRWSRLVMGFKPSPYQAVRDNRRAKFQVLGTGDAFGWDSIERNYPGSASYAPDRPWISKRTAEGHIACDVMDYVDDNRTTGHSYEAVWRASTNLAKGYTYLGIQDATRKRRSPTQDPGPWAGAIVRTKGDVRLSVSQERWDKTKAWLATISKAHEDWEARPTEVGGLDRKLLERARGFLVYVARAYTPLRPYLKGLHLTIDGWRPDREDGWRDRDLKEWWLEQNEDQSIGALDPPVLVKPVTRLKGDLEALRSLTVAEAPPELPVRASRSAVACYGFGDASGDGFGVSIWDPRSGVDATQGLWMGEVSAASSNFREALNLVLKLEDMVREGSLHAGVELFLFTDNYVTETVFEKGDARSKPLFDLVLRLRQLEMRHGLFVRVIWVSGRRMIAQGTDGLSRGDLTTGVMAGDGMLSFVPLALSAADRSPHLVSRVVDDWVPPPVGHRWSHLSEDHWYTIPFKEDGLFVWTPPPCVADVAVALAAEAHHIRPWNTHLVPSLMTHRWRRQLSKAADLLVVLPFDAELWPEETQFECLTLAIICPLLRAAPWRVERSGLRGRVIDALQGLREPSISLYGDRVREFWIQATELGFMPGSVARSMLHAPGGGPVPGGAKAPPG